MSMLLTLAIIAAAAALSVAFMWLVHGRVREEGVLVDFEARAHIFVFLSTAFAVLLAFVVLEAYERYNDVRSGADQEAVAVIEQSRTADAFEPRSQDRIEGLLVCYGRAVIAHEWRAMEEGRSSGLVDTWVVRLRTAATHIRVNSPAENSFLLQFLGEQDARTDGRQIRITEASRGVPAPMWLVLVLGATLTTAWVLMFTDRRISFAVQGIGMGAVAALASASLLLIWSLDQPYSGSGAIEPDRMAHAVLTVEDQQRTVEPLCTPTGEPLAPRVTAES